MRRCKNLVSGEICEYFIMGIDEEPEWYGNSSKWFNHDGGSILVNSKLEETIFKFSHDKTFSEKYEILDLGEQPTEAEEDENRIIVREFDMTKSDACRSRETNEVFECIWGMTSVDRNARIIYPDWYDVSVLGFLPVNTMAVNYGAGDVRILGKDEWNAKYIPCSDIDIMFFYMENR